MVLTTPMPTPTPRKNKSYFLYNVPHSKFFTYCLSKFSKFPDFSRYFYLSQSDKLNYAKVRITANCSIQQLTWKTKISQRKWRGSSVLFFKGIIRGTRTSNSVAMKQRSSLYSFNHTLSQLLPPLVIKLSEYMKAKCCAWMYLQVTVDESIDLWHALMIDSSQNHYE